MQKNFGLRFAILFSIVILCALIILPTFTNIKEDSYFPFKSKMSMGLDLQGGLYMVMGVDFNKVYRDEIKNYADQIVRHLNENNMPSEIGILEVDNISDPHHSIVVKDAGDVEKAKEKIKEFFSYPVRIVNEKGTELSYGLHKNFKTDIEANSITKSIEVIRNRIDEFGVTEPEIVSMGKDRVVIQLPGVADIERAKGLIGKTAKLEFKMVNDEISDATLATWLDKATKSGLVYKKGDRFSEYTRKINEFLKTDIPKGHEILFERVTNKISNEPEQQIPYLVELSPGLLGDDLQDAGVRIDQQENRPYVAITFKSLGTKKFEELTGKNVGRRMAVVLDDNVYTAPVIQDRIGGGSASITLGRGGYNELLTQARDISLVLRAGALPVELEFQEQRVVGPSLGGDAIAKAEFGTIVGAVLVFLFCLIYYRVSGVIVVTTLIVNVLIIMAGLVLIGATLTLPGIAGIALTVGMAVDANIIINERIKEELAEGKSKFAAVEAGFDKAFWAIIDGNLTTAVAGFCLINFGTGPIRGFAVTLLIGIAATIYAAYFVGKLLMEYYVNKSSSQTVSI
ncbi:MAG: protein translocase subunit SecD [Bacteriovoracaceae bacterium]|nr:protein translocase subunit SecD [Bacteriovoracaceae bacterium]